MPAVSHAFPGSPRWSRVVGLIVLLAVAGSGLEAGKGRRIEDRIRGQHIAAVSPPLERPAVRPVTSATHMRDDDLVFGVTVAGEARAYPWWVAKNYHVVNDAVGGLAVAVAFCEQCSGAAAFSRKLDGRVLSFEVAGVYNATIILRDRQTQSLWAPFSGRAVEGRLKGRRLERLPLSFTRWDTWAARHPAGQVVWGSPSSRGGHGSWYEPGKWGIVSEMGATLEAWDPRLPENALVYGLEDGGSAKVYPLSQVQAHGGVVNDRLGQTPVVVLAKGPFDVAAYERRAKGRPLTFRASPGLHAVMNDDETGSDWSGEGEAVGGPLKGEHLKPVDGYLVEWHVWSAYHPGAEVFGPAAPADAAAVPEGLTFPSLVLQGLEGRPRAVTLPGKLNLVVLWAAWCPPCKVEMPRLQRLVEKHAAQGLSAVGIAIHMPDDDIEKAVVKDFVAEARVTFPTFLVDEPGYDRLESLCRSTGGPGLVLPTVFVTDARGRILLVRRGNDVETFPEALEGLLGRGLADSASQ
jgi:thiol-disulfide isomerase/thioredoxin